MLRHQKSKRRKEVGHKKSKAQSGIKQCCSSCQSNQCCSNLGVVREKIQALVSPKVAICLFPNLNTCTLMGFGFNLICNIKRRRALHRRAARNYHQSNQKERRRRSELKSVVTATLDNRAELLDFDFHCAQLIFIFFL